MDKENTISKEVYDQIVKSQEELTNYLKYIRHKQPVPKIRTHNMFLHQTLPQKQYTNKFQKAGIEVKRYIQNYLETLRQTFSLEIHLSKKVIKKFVQYLEELPSMNFLFQTTFGKQKKKLVLNQSSIIMHANDDMAGNFQKIIDKLTNLKRQVLEVKRYVELYLSAIKEVQGLQSYLSKKIVKKLLQFLQQIPAMCFLYQVTNSFGKDKKKISYNYQNIITHANDDMIPLFEKIIHQIENLKKQGESKKLMQLGHRIQHLQSMIGQTKKCVRKDVEHAKIFKTFQSDRIQKYILMEENITKAQKNYGEFSVNLLKNKEVFSNLNKVYFRIKNSAPEI